MITIKLSPQRRDDQYTLSTLGDILIINGVQFDFTQLEIGATIPSDAIDSEYIQGDVSRLTDGALELTLILPHGANAPVETRFPTPLSISVDGVIELPLYNEPEIEEGEVSP